ncbi:HalOD1 output domain-containing protein [Halostella litorea]|uniref:HalOD1 output domain-containing protein n=1 Tax=Halostella litorea TaxID=2528831 RepID=UPI001091B385|nr:HalOD1 output domain-containing protein [Halostella litorea]
MDSTDTVRYDPESETYTARHAQGGGRTAVHSVVEAVAAATDSEPTAMEPLYETLDPHALDWLCGRGGERGRTSPGTVVSFRFEGCAVSVHADGRAVVSKRGDRP